MTRTRSFYLGSVAVLLSPAAVYADIIYNLSGLTASDLSEVTGVLTLGDSYTPGTALTSADFISFVFSSELQNYSVPETFDFSAAINIALPEFQGYAITSGQTPGNSGFDFVGNSTYLWLFGDGLWESANGIHKFSGIHAVWTRQILHQVPEPNALALLGVALFGMGLIGCKKSWQRRKISIFTPEQVTQSSQNR